MNLTNSWLSDHAHTFQRVSSSEFRHKSRNSWLCGGWFRVPRFRHESRNSCASGTHKAKSFEIHVEARNSKPAPKKPRVSRFMSKLGTRNQPPQSQEFRDSCRNSKLETPVRQGETFPEPYRSIYLSISLSLSIYLSI